MLRPCLGTPDGPCPDGATTPRTRCPRCRGITEAARPSRRALGRYDARWVKLRAIAIRRQPWCSGYKRPPHPATDLTGDHRIPLGQGGKSVMSNIDVLCRACNSAKRDRVEVRG